MADFYGTVQRRLSIDGRVFQVGVDVGDLEFHDDGAQAVVAAHYGDTRFPNPVAVIEQVASRTMGEREYHNPDLYKLTSLIAALVYSVLYILVLLSYHLYTIPYSWILSQHLFGQTL